MLAIIACVPQYNACMHADKLCNIVLTCISWSLDPLYRTILLTKMIVYRVIPNQFNQSFHMIVSESDEAGFV